MLGKPAALLSDVSSRLWNGTNNNNASSSSSSDSSNSSTKTTAVTNTHGSTSGKAASTSSQAEKRAPSSSSNDRKKRLSAPSGLIVRLNNRHHASTVGGGSSDTVHQDVRGTSVDINIISGLSIAPTHHRENTAFHALRDTFYLPSPRNLLPPLPTIPCMSGLGQSNLFSESPVLGNDSSATSTPRWYPGDLHLDIPQHARTRLNTKDDENMTTHHQKAGALLTGDKSDSFNKLKGLNVLMLGGYRGSILRDARTGRRLWAPLRVGLNVRKAELAIGLTEEDELQTTQTVVPGKSLAAIAGFVDLGKRLKDRLKQMDKDGQIHFHSWGYDWRRNLDLSSAELVTYLENLKIENGQSTLVIAHSMGGLVALHALARAADPRIFKGIIFGSPPFNGTPNILQPFKHGDSILMNKDICSPSTVFSFRSSFYLLPSNNACFYNADGQLHPVNFLDAKEWARYGFSPMTVHLGEASPAREEAREEATQADSGGMAPTGVQQLGETSTHASKGTRGIARSDNNDDHKLPEVSDERIFTYLEGTLSKVKVFREELTSLYDRKKTSSYPPMVLISSTKTATVKGCLVNGEQDILDGKYDRLLFGEGDGIILHESASALPEVWRQHQIGHLESHNGHVSILSDLNSIRRAIDLIMAERIS